jgi:CDP-paratose 2-epimerase
MSGRTAEKEANVHKPIAAIGFLEWFHLGDYEKVEKVLADLHILQVKDLRIGISWADYHAPQGKEWYEWLISRLGRTLRLLPCVHYIPPSLGVEPKISSPPKFPKQYADFIDLLITKFDGYFEHLELWNEPNNLADWDWRLDPGMDYFCGNDRRCSVLG